MICFEYPRENGKGVLKPRFDVPIRYSPEIDEKGRK
jgi:hypothetical protein